MPLPCVGSGRHTVAMTPACCRHGGFLLLGAWGGVFLLLLFSSFPPQGLADPSMCSGTYALHLPSGEMSLSLFLLTPVAARGAYSQPINIEIQLDACLLGGEPGCFVHACVPQPCTNHGLWLPDAVPVHCGGLSPVPKATLRFSSSFFTQKIKNHSCNGAPLKVKASQCF